MESTLRALPPFDCIEPNSAIIQFSIHSLTQTHGLILIVLHHTQNTMY